MALFDFVWDSRWTNTSKPRDRDRPFHRINSPSFDETRQPADGRGYDCGCRSPFFDYGPSFVEIISTMILNILGAIPLIIFKELMRTAPSWVPVERKNVPPAQMKSFKEEEKEVEGVLWRSFQTWTDVPLEQWHTWYDWNFHLVPATGYTYLRGKGNEPHGDDGPEPPKEPVGRPDTMECEWDTGAISAVQTGPNVMGPMFLKDWAWPQAGQYMWIVGRWIYDCGHASSEEKDGPNAGLMRTELHPCKAVASARWEAFNFDENNGLFTPSIQFMFFASKKGGYKDFSTINDVDYEFIIDLPTPPASETDYAIGHTPDVPMNTIVLRPRLLKKFDYAPFDNAAGTKAKPGQADPEIELLRNPIEGKAPEQAKIKIPLTKLSKQTDSYGVLISLGWHDGAGTQAATVKKVTVNLEHIKTKDTDHDEFLRGSGEWTVKIGVNGRWKSVRDEDVSSNSQIRIGEEIQFHLAENDTIIISAHGMEEDDVGSFINRPPDKRKLFFGNFEEDKKTGPIEWERDVDQPDNELSSIVARNVVNKLFTTWNNQNDPLGLIDQGMPMFLNDSPNPIKVKDVKNFMNPQTKVMNGVLTACFTEEVGSTAELVFDRTQKDYQLIYSIRVEDQ